MENRTVLSINPFFFSALVSLICCTKEKCEERKRKRERKLKNKSFWKEIFTLASPLDLFLINNIRLGKKTICTNFQISNHSIKEFNEKWWRFCRNETNIWRFRANRKLMEGDKEEDSKQGMKKSVLFFFLLFQERY